MPLTNSPLPVLIPSCSSTILNHDRSACTPNTSFSPVISEPTSKYPLTPPINYSLPDKVVQTINTSNYLMTLTNKKCINAGNDIDDEKKKKNYESKICKKRKKNSSKFLQVTKNYLKCVNLRMF